MGDDIDYLLTVQTNGRADCLEKTFAAFFQHVRPTPSQIYVFDDGHATGVSAVEDLLAAHAHPVMVEVPYQYDGSSPALGMCLAYARCWARAAVAECPWVFHLEDDQVILRPVDLNALALVQGSTWGADRSLAQMALVRAPWGAEIPHGGYIPQSPGWYHRRQGGPYEWIETTRNWATSPALFRTELARAVEWPEEANCEGLFGHRVRACYPEAVFGLWGWGENWYSHVGVERGGDAHGY